MPSRHSAFGMGRLHLSSSEAQLPYPYMPGEVPGKLLGKHQFFLREGCFLKTEGGNLLVDPDWLSGLKLAC